jgi:hypothetical protein
LLVLVDDDFRDDVDVVKTLLVLSELELLLLLGFVDVDVESVLLFAEDKEDVEDLSEEAVVEDFIDDDVDVDDGFDEVVLVDESVLLLLDDDKVDVLLLLKVVLLVESEDELEVVVLLVLEVFEELVDVSFELELLALDEWREDVVLVLDVLVAVEELLFALDVVLILDVLLILDEVLMLDVLVATTEELVEDGQPPTMLGTASVPLPIATILEPQFAACAKWILKLS